MELIHQSQGNGASPMKPFAYCKSKDVEVGQLSEVNNVQHVGPSKQVPTCSSGSQNADVPSSSACAQTELSPKALQSATFSSGPQKTEVPVTSDYTQTEKIPPNEISYRDAAICTNEEELGDYSHGDFEMEGINKEEKLIKQKERSFYREKKCFNESHMSLEDEVNTLRTTLNCKVCFSTPVENLFYPCCHLVACGKCSEQLVKCPICRTIIKTRFRIFMV